MGFDLVVRNLYGADIVHFESQQASWLVVGRNVHIIEEATELKCML